MSILDVALLTWALLIAHMNALGSGCLKQFLGLRRLLRVTDQTKDKEHIHMLATKMQIL